MKFKSLILTLLLSAFAFVIIHDFVVQHYDADVQIETSYVHTHNKMMCDASVLHEHIHSMMFYAIDSELYVVESVNFSPTFLEDSQHTNTTSKALYRPPIS
jgi:Ni2+-binding GTPase involved in maturation of urease and hydrogenase